MIVYDTLRAMPQGKPFHVNRTTQGSVKRPSLQTRGFCRRIGSSVALFYLAVASLSPALCQLPAGDSPLQQAVRKHDAVEVQRLLDSGADVDYLNANDETALDLSAGLDFRDTVEVLLEHHANIDQNNSKGDTALIYAARASALHSLQTLLAAKALVNHADVNDYTALDATVSKRNPSTTSLLLAAAADPNFRSAKRDPILFDLAYSQVETNDEVSTLKTLLDAGALPNVIDNTGYSVLFWAAYYGKPDSVRLLVEHGANPDFQEEPDHRTPIMTALLGAAFHPPDPSRIAALDLLIDAAKSLDLASARGETALSDAIEFGNVEAVKRLILRHASPNLIAGLFHETPLLIACRQPNLVIVQLLIAAGADVSQPSDGGTLPIHEAAIVGSLEVLKTLVGYGADINSPDLRRDTPLHLAAYNGYLGLVQYLIDKGAAINPRRITGETPYGLALKAGHNDIADFLKSHGGTQ